MKASRIPWITLLVIIGVGGVAVAGSIDSPYEWNEPQPPITSQEQLTTRISDSALGITLAPPVAAITPVVDGEDAVAKVWAEEGAPGDPKEIHLTFALLTWPPDFKETPVWVVTYLGGDCIPAVGGPGDFSSCADQPFHTLVDAITGEYIASITSPELGAAGL